MSMTDPVSDMLTRIRNAQLVRHDRTDIPASKLKVEVARILRDEGYIRAYKVIEDEGDPQRKIRIYLKYSDAGEPVIHGLRRVSSPGRRVYRGADQLPRVRNGLGVAIVSTNRGILTDAQARQERTGGEVLCEVW